MSDAPTFLRRKLKSPSEIDTGIHEILSKLKATADRDVFEVLAQATNTYLNAVVRFTGQGTLVARDVDNLLTVWQIMLDVGKDRVDRTGQSIGLQEIEQGEENE